MHNHRRLDLILRHDMIDGTAEFRVARGINPQRFSKAKPDEIGVMNVQVEQRAARKRPIGKMRLPPAGRLRDTFERHAQQPPITPLLNAFLEPDKFRPEPHAHGRHEKTFGLGCRAHDLPGQGGGAGERLFTEHMFAGTQGGDHQVRVLDRGRANVDERDLRVGQQFLEMPVCLDPAHVEAQRVPCIKIAAHSAEVAIQMSPAWIA